MKFLSKQLIANKEVALYQNAEGYIEGFYGKGKLTLSVEGGNKNWDSLERVVTNCKTEDEAAEYIRKYFQKKPRVKTILPVIDFPE